MALLMGSWLADCLLLLALIFWLLYKYFSSTRGYFKARGIPYLEPTPFLGHYDTFVKTQMELSLGLYHQFPGKKYFGYFQAKTPVLLVKDPRIIHRITVKDFAHFHDRGFTVIEGDELVTKNLFHMRGEAWKLLRTKLTPTFTSGKLKLMFEQFMKCGEHLLENIETGVPVEVKSLSTTYATEVIGSTAFGLSFTKDNPQTHEFISKIATTFVSGFRMMVLNILILFLPRLLIKLFKLSFVTSGMEEYFINLTKATKEYRKSKNVKRNDYFQLLMSLQEAEESGNHSLTTDDNDKDVLIDQMQYSPQLPSSPESHTKFFNDRGLVAQAVVFLSAGTDSVSGVLSFALYHIAKDPEVQRLVVSEVDTVLTKHGGTWSYQALKEMVYLDQVIQETMRLYPLIPLNFRECTVPYTLPDTDAVLEKGMKVAIPVMGLHMDPKYYPDPEVFNPNRFVDNNHKPSSTYMPFGDGPRICIAIRFVLVELKVCLAMLTSDYSMEVDQKTQQPLKYDKNAFSPRIMGGLWLRFTKRQR